MKHCLFFILLIFSICTFAQTAVTGKVVKIVDGDTFDVLTKDNATIKIRMYGIDAPEIKGGQPYCKKSKDYLASMIAGKFVSVDVKNEDKYGRKVGVVSTDDIADVNLEMIKAGYAWHYKFYDNTPAYKRAQKDARANHRGLWYSPNPINPYDWRKGKREF